MKNLLLIAHLLLFSYNYGQIQYRYEIKNIDINSKYSEMGTSFYGPNRVYFASNKNHAKTTNVKASKVYEAPNYDIYKGLVSTVGELNYVEEVENESISKYNDSNTSFTPDMKKVYFTQNVEGEREKRGDLKEYDIQIFQAEIKVNGEWTNIQSIPFNKKGYSTAHPSVDEDNKILFFSSNLPGSLGASDIFWVETKSNNTYGQPYNLGSHVNTVYRDNFPYVDGNILYFSSDRPGGLGGLDIYMVLLDQPNAVAVNLGEPINSPSDDFGFVIDRKNKRGFFTSDRPGGKGQDDIYYFTQVIDDQEQCKQVVEGVIYDKITKKPLPDATVRMISHNKIVLATLPVKPDGSYRFELACRDQYRVEVIREGYKDGSHNIIFTPYIFKQNISLYLEPLEEIISEKIDIPEPKIQEEKIELPIVEETIQEEPEEKIIPTIIRNNQEILDIPMIYFELDSHTLLPEAQKTIERAINIMSENPNLHLKFTTHTDCRASASYNLHLSDLRAREVLEYMLDNGVSSECLTAQGYGESRPVNHCVDGVDCTEKEHQENRRAEFVIIKK
jgi:outer membrane protein OmpA-like peptidoglycan-associated protein